MMVVVDLRVCCMDFWTIEKSVLGFMVILVFARCKVDFA